MAARTPGGDRISHGYFFSRFSFASRTIDRAKKRLLLVCATIFFSRGFLSRHVHVSERGITRSREKLCGKGQKRTVKWHTSRSVTCPASPTGLSLPPLPESSLSSSDGSSFIIRNLNCRRQKTFKKNLQMPSHKLDYSVIYEKGFNEKRGPFKSYTL